MPDRPKDEPKLKAFVQEARWTCTRTFFLARDVHLLKRFSEPFGLSTGVEKPAFCGICIKAKLPKGKPISLAPTQFFVRASMRNVR
jgi:hypothetical protein